MILLYITIYYPSSWGISPTKQPQYMPQGDASKRYFKIRTPSIKLSARLAVRNFEPRPAFKPEVTEVRELSHPKDLHSVSWAHSEHSVSRDMTSTPTKNNIDLKKTRSTCGTPQRYFTIYTVIHLHTVFQGFFRLSLGCI